MVDYISYNGEEYPVKLAMIALKNFESDPRGIPLGEIGEDLHLHALLLWHAIKVGYEFIEKDFYKKKKVEGKMVKVPALTKKDCYWILDEKFTDYFDIFIESMAKISGQDMETVKEQITEEIKKK